MTKEDIRKAVLRSIGEALSDEELDTSDLSISNKDIYFELSKDEGDVCLTLCDLRALDNALSRRGLDIGDIEVSPACGPGYNCRLEIGIRLN